MQINPKSKGLGDSIEKFTKATGIKTVVEAVTKLAGLPEGSCGCDERKQYLNELFPYGKIRKFRMINDFELGGVKYKKGDILKLSKEDDLHSYIISLVRDKIVEEI